VRNELSKKVFQSELEKQLPDSSQHCLVLVYDVTDAEKVKAAFNDIRKSGKQLQGLVNNAGVMLDSALGMTTLNDFSQQMSVNVTASFQHLQLAARLMTRQKSGSIVNISSVVAIEGSAGQVAYSASKAAILGMTKSAAKELAPLGISVNAVAPGFIGTKLTAAYQKQKRQNVVDNIAVGREGKPADVSALVLHLLSNEAAYITGQTIKIDGMMKLN
jgi:3-oxoacyl-[acyl-carrier protein] reductase